jgi:hypothetical protein
VGWIEELCTQVEPIAEAYNAAARWPAALYRTAGRARWSHSCETTGQTGNWTLDVIAVEIGTVLGYGSMTEVACHYDLQTGGPQARQTGASRCCFVQAGICGHFEEI